MLSLCEYCIRDPKGLPENRALPPRDSIFERASNLANWSQGRIEILENISFPGSRTCRPASQSFPELTALGYNWGWNLVVHFEAPPTLIEHQDFRWENEIGPHYRIPSPLLITSTLFPSHPHQKIPSRRRTSQCEQLLD